MFDWFARLDEPRFRSWVQAGLAIALPASVVATMHFTDQGAHADIHLALVGMLFAMLAGCALSGLALLSGLAGLFALDRPRPVWRYLEPWLLGLPFIALVLMIVAGGAAQLYY